MIYKYKGEVYSDGYGDLNLLLEMVSTKEKEVDSVYKGTYYYFNGVYIGSDGKDDLEDIIDKLIENGIDIKPVDDDAMESLDDE